MTHTIVLIDQNSARRFERTTELHRLGFKVRGVPDGSLAAVMAAGESVDAYLVDEDSGGFDLCFALDRSKDLGGPGGFARIPCHRAQETAERSWSRPHFGHSDAVRIPRVGDRQCPRG